MFYPLRFNVPLLRRFILVSSLIFSFSITISVEARFVDESDFPSWAEDAIEMVNEARIMTGYGDGRFAPDELLNRAQAITLLLRIKEIEEEDDGEDDLFEDVPSGSWFRKAVSSGVKRGWIKGRSNKVFAPEASLTRAEWAAMISRVYEFDEAAASDEYEYYDVPAQVWFTSYVYAMTENDLVRFPKSSYYRPEKLVTRAEAAWTMAQIMSKSRLMGTGTENDFGSKRGVDHHRIAVKPKDFNPNLQGYEIEKEELRIDVVVAEGETILSPSSDFTYLGSLEVKNAFKDDDAQFDSLQLKLRFDDNRVGPIDEFEVQLVGDGYDEIVSLNRSGEALYVGMNLSFEPQEIMNFEVFLRPVEGAQFYQDAGSGIFYVYDGGALVSRVFKSSGNAGTRYAPVGIKERNLATIFFDPTK